MLIKMSLRGAKQACPCVSRGSNLNGFSLIELMVAVVILALAIFGIFLAFSTGFQGMADARDRTVATNLAQEKIEGIKNIPFADINTYITDNNGTTVISGKEFTINIVSVNYEEEADDNLKKVTTTVSWDVDKEVELVTLIYNL